MCQEMCVCVQNVKDINIKNNQAVPLKSLNDTFVGHVPFSLST